MSDRFVPRLTLGTLFSLLIEAKPNTARSGRMDSNYASPGTEPRLLGDLIRILWPSNRDQWSPSTLENNTAKVKNCSKLVRIGWLPFDQASFVDEGCKTFEAKRKVALKATKEFLKKDLDAGSEYKISLLGRRILELIMLDDSILDEAELPIKPNCSILKKAEINEKMSFNIEPLILGVFYFIIKNKIDNSLGKETHENWYGEPDSSNVRHFKDGAFDPIKFADTSIDLLNDDDETLVERDDDQNTSSPTSFLNSYNFDDYIENLKAEYTSIKTFVADEGPRDFDEFYVCNKISYTSKERNANGLKVQDKLLNATTTDIREKCSNYVILTGTGGLGKSMMMNHLLLSAIDAYPQDKLVPVFIKLNEFKGGTGYLSDFIFEKIKGFSHYFQTDQFYELLKNGNFIFLFDGLDEIDFSERKRFEDQLNKFTCSYSGNSFIISSRQDSKFVTLNRYSIIRLEPLEKLQSKELIQKIEYGKNDPVTKQRFIEKLDTELYDRHQDFASNPLLLTIMYITYENSGNVPPEKHNFYRRAYDALAEKHDANKSGYERAYYTNSNGDRLGDFLSAFSYVSLLKDKRSFTEEEFEIFFSLAKSRMLDLRAEENFTAKQFIQDLMYSLCIIQMNGGLYCFVHDSFQEYFCAKFISKISTDSLGKIGLYLESHPYSMVAKTEMFSMLYSMEPNNIKEKVFIPFLEKILFNGETSEDKYLNFLDYCFGEIHFNYGNYRESNNQPISYLFDFITSIATNIKTARELNDFDYIDGLVNTDYISVFVNNEFGYSLEPFNKTALLHDEEMPEIEGAHMSVEVKDMINNKDQYRDLIDSFKSDYCDLYEEYQELCRYYNDLKTEHEKATDSLLDFIEE